MATNLENLYVWNLSRLPIQNCQKCEGYEFNCKNYLTYKQSRDVKDILTKYEELVRRIK